MDGRFFTKCVRIIIEKAVSICVIIPQNRKVKKFQLHTIDQSFEHNGMGISYQKKLEGLEEKKAAHTSSKHGASALRFAWKNVTLDTLRELAHSIPHRLEIVRKHTGRHSGY